jgi:hypothetical protein
MQPAKIQEIRTWLTKALQDLRSAEWLLASPAGFTPQSDSIASKLPRKH